MQGEFNSLMGHQEIMSNHKRKPNYQASRSCGLCKPHKRVGNSKERIKPKYRLQKVLTLA